MSRSSQPAKKQSSFKPWLVWGLGCLFYFYECLLQVSPSVMSAELMHDFSVTSHMLGILSGVYFYFYAGMQLPCGVMTDYFGPRRLLTIATTICAVSTMHCTVNDWFWLCFCGGRHPKTCFLLVSRKSIRLFNWHDGYAWNDGRYLWRGTFGTPN